MGAGARGHGLICPMRSISPRGWDGNVEGRGSGVVLDGRQQHKPPGTKVGVAGQRAGMLEPEDQGRKPAVRRDRSRGSSYEVDFPFMADFGMKADMVAP